MALSYRVLSFFGFPKYWDNRWQPEVEMFILLSSVRLILVCGFLYRSTTHNEEMKVTPAPYGVETEILVWISAAVYLLWWAYSSYKTLHLIRRQLANTLLTTVFPNRVNTEFLPKQFAWKIVFIDVLTFTDFYILSLRLQSDLFLYYLVPLLSGTMYLKPSVGRLSLLIVGALASSLLVIHFNVPYASIDPSTKIFTSPHRIFTNIFLLRAAFLVTAVVGMTLCIQSFRNSRDLYSSLVDYLPIVLWRKNKDGEFTYVNPKFLQTIPNASESKQVLGKTDAQLFGWDFAEKVRADDLEVMRTGAPKIDTAEQFPTATAGAEARFNYVVKVATFNRRGAVDGTQGFFLDNTEHVETCLLAFVGQTAETIRHALLNSSTYLELNLEALAASMADGRDGREFIDILQKESRQINDRLSQFAAIGTTKMQYDLIEVIPLLQKFSERLMSEFRQISIQIDNSPIVTPEGFWQHFRGDRTKFELAIENVLRNACDELSRRNCVDQTVNVTFVQRGPGELEGALEICIRNQGHLDSLTREKLHKGVRVSTKRAGQTSGLHGLGAWSVRHCMELHGGRFMIDCIDDVVTAMLIIPNSLSQEKFPPIN